MTGVKCSFRVKETKKRIIDDESLEKFGDSYQRLVLSLRAL
jgi:hypothetical protein